MYNNISNRSRGTWTRGFAALLAALATGLGLVASRAEAAPFVYVANSQSSEPFPPSTVSVIDAATNTVAVTVPAGGDLPIAVAVTLDGKHAYVVNQDFAPRAPGVVSVIDTTTNAVVTTVEVGQLPVAVAVPPDGKHAYVVNAIVYPLANGSVSVIDTATNTLEATTIMVGNNPVAAAITPDGKHLYVANGDGTVSVIDTATNTVVATVPLPVASNPAGIAITPDGKHVYVTNDSDGSAGTVSVIDTATNTVEAAAIPVGGRAIAITPDGKHAYVANWRSNTVSVINTASNTVVGPTIPVGNEPLGVAVTPDGKHVYVTNLLSENVSVIDTTSNSVVATVTVGVGPYGVGIVPPPPGVPFLAFNAALNIDFGTAPNTDAFTLGTSFTLSSTAPVINPLTAPVNLQIGTFAVMIPAGSFRKNHQGDFVFSGVINGVTLKVAIKSTGTTLGYNFQAGAQNASLTGTTNPVPVTLTIGSNSGATSVTAKIFGTTPAVTAAKFH